ncbi:lipid IV(A) 3-deoxy-D-manno-octulosonic acid transferase [Orbaceae bacterium ESL0721]|nr:lipid IV(A) 3-deoxy-D-manno-octulosonic acid transferase [Orbaceae bacterium ESL0721]
MQILYTILLYLIQPIIWLRLLWRSRKAPAYRQRILERYGFGKGKVKPDGILVHAVSVGETVAAIPLIKALQKEYPNLPITVTTMTPTGSDRVKTTFGDTVSHVYLPYDLPCAVKRFLNQLRPKVVIIMETELWPTLICELNKRDIPLIIANARLSERSAKGYAKLGKTIRHLLPKITMIAAQNQVDGERFIQLGLPSTHLSITGSIKFDIDLSDEQKDQIKTLKQNWQLNRPVLIAASTHAGEDELILATFKQLLKKHPNLLLILVPRHPERFRAVEKLLIDSRLTYALRSQNHIPTDQTQVVLGDTMGELMQLYGIADIALVGGSFVAHGGHNPLEPALHHLPIIMGEHFFNFAIIVKQLIDANGVTINTEADLYRTIDKLLSDADLQKEMGENSYRILKQNQGALDRLLTIIKRYLS